MIGEMDGVIEKLSKQKADLIHDIEAKEEQVKHAEDFTDQEDSLKRILGQIDEEK